MLMITLYAEQKKRHRFIEQSFRLCGRRRGWDVSREQPFFFPGDLPNPEIGPKSPALQAGSLPAEPQGKPKNTGMGSLSLLQQIFPTQNWILHYY